MTINIYDGYHSDMAVRKLSQYLIRVPQSDLKRWAKAARELEAELGVRVSLASYIRQAMKKATDATLSKTG